MNTVVEKIALVALSLVILIVLGVSPAKAQVGVAGGYNLDIITDPGFDGPTTNSLETPGGFSVGIFYNFPLGERLAIRPGLYLQQSSFDWQLDDVEFSPLQDDLRIASIPIDVRYRFHVNQITPYVLAGPGFNFVHTNQPDLRHVLIGQQTGSTHFFGINIGGGVEIPFATLGLSLQPEIRYSHALSGFLQEDYIIRTVEFNADGSQRLNNLSFRLGISFLTVGFED